MLRPRGPPRLSYSKGSMATSCGTWRCKPSKRKAEVKPTSSLPARLLCTLAQQSSRALWWLPTTFYWGRHLHLTCSSYHKGTPQWRNSNASATSPTPVPKQSPKPQRWHPSPDPVESMPLGGTTLKATSEGLPRSKQQEILPWDRAFKPSHAEAFGQDSDLVKEPGRNSSWNIPTTSSWRTPAISWEIFRQIATSAELLGTSIYEIQASWMGPDGLKQANTRRLFSPKQKNFWLCGQAFASFQHGLFMSEEMLDFIIL